MANMYNVKDLYVVKVGIVNCRVVERIPIGDVCSVYCDSDSLNKPFNVIKKEHYKRGYREYYPLGISVINGTEYKYMQNNDLKISEMIGLVMIDTEIPLGQFVNGDKISIQDIINLEESLNDPLKGKSDKIFLTISYLALACHRLDDERKPAFLERINEIGRISMDGVIEANSLASKDMLKKVIDETSKSLAKFRNDLNSLGVLERKRVVKNDRK